jgi:hypothetical protein
MNMKLTTLLLIAAAQLASRAAFIEYTATLDPLAESPPHPGSLASGSAIVDLDTVAHTLRVRVTFTGLTAPASGAHIHAPTTTPFTGTTGVATTVPAFPGFPLGVTSGNYDGILDLLSAAAYNPAFVTANGGSLATSEAVLTAALASGQAYLNIHDAEFPGGEIRGFLVAAPDAGASAALLLLGLGGIGLFRRAVRTV